MEIQANQYGVSLGHFCTYHFTYSKVVKNNTYSSPRCLKLSMKVMIHTVNMNQVKKPQRFDIFLTNIIINTLSSQKVNYIIFFSRLGTQLTKWLNPLILALCLPVIFTTDTFYIIQSHLEAIPSCSPHMIFNILPTF